MTLRRRFIDGLKTVLLEVYRIGLRFNVVILPNRFDTGVPDLNILARTKDTWTARSDMAGIHWDAGEQEQLLCQVMLPFQDEYRENQAYRDATRAARGPGFGAVEAQALHGFLRHYQPRKVIEVGSGVSTSCMLAASRLNRENGGREQNILCVEPYPRDWLRSAPVELIEKPVQQVSLEVFQSLEAGDFLFIDSSHTIQTGGDVNYLVLEVLPRLKPGVLVHFHDINFPYDYPRDALTALGTCQENALLHAFLAGNPRFGVLFCLSLLHYDRPDTLRRVFPEYTPQANEQGLRSNSYPAFGEIREHFPSSLYLAVTA
jgi:hypothetical protein